VPLAEYAGYDVEFFDGERLGVPDDYISLPLKAKGIFKWAFEKGFNCVLKCDDDAYINVDKLEYPGVDYGGLTCGPNDLGKPQYGIPPFPKGTFPHVYASGGAVWFSRKAIEILVEAPLNGDFADDRWVGHVLFNKGIRLTVLPNFHWYPHAMPTGSNFSVITQLPIPEILKWHGVVAKNPVSTPAANSPAAVPRTPPISVGARPDWRGTIMGAKVNHAIARGFKVAAVCPFGSSYHSELRRMMPEHVEEVIDMPDGRKVLFLVRENK
jgi:hypothetical protein